MVGQCGGCEPLVCIHGLWLVLLVTATVLVAPSHRRTVATAATTAFVTATAGVTATANRWGTKTAMSANHNRQGNYEYHVWV